MKNLFQGKLRVINVGLASFAETIAGSDGEAVQVDWAPPGTAQVLEAQVLARLAALPEIAAANERAFAAYTEARPVLAGIGLARDSIPGMVWRAAHHGLNETPFRRLCSDCAGTKSERSGSTPNTSGSSLAAITVTSAVKPACAAKAALAPARAACPTDHHLAVDGA